MSCSTTAFSSSAMSQSILLGPQNIPGYGVPDGSFLSFSGISARTSAVSVSPCSSHVGYRVFSHVKITATRCASGTPSFVCKASSGEYRRNPDSSSQVRQGNSRNGSRQNEERHSHETVDEYDIFKNELLSSSNSKSQITAAPGQKEGEIVELFRKVQAQIRESESIKYKEEKRDEAPKDNGSENGTIDSLLKLLRKHAAEYGDDQKVNRVPNGDSAVDHPDRTWGFHEDESLGSVLHTNKRSRNRPQEPRVKMPRVDPSEEDHGKRQESPETFGEPGEEPEMEGKLLQDGDTLNEEELSESEDEALDLDDDNNEEDGKELSSLKLTELREIAKTRGVNGYSKMKNTELVELLTNWWL
ncbi:Rho-N domain-containing protein 1, chloroplastic [Linum perenne]